LQRPHQTLGWRTPNEAYLDPPEIFSRGINDLRLL
jgi:hypothetical protein